MRKLFMTALATSLVAGLISAALSLGAVASEGLMIVAIAVTLPFVLGISRQDVRARIQRR